MFDRVPNTSMCFPTETYVKYQHYSTYHHQKNSFDEEGLERFIIYTNRESQALFIQIFATTCI